MSKLAESDGKGHPAWAESTGLGNPWGCASLPLATSCFAMSWPEGNLTLILSQCKANLEFLALFWVRQEKSHAFFI